MKTKVIKVDPRYPESGFLKEAAQILKNGGLVAFPTDTVYGLGANAFDEKALNRLFTVKKRPLDKPLIVLVDEVQKVKFLVALHPRRATLTNKLMEEFWPGPLSLILPSKNDLPSLIRSENLAVGLRIPDNLVARGLFRLVGLPVATTSANISGCLSSSTAAEVLSELKGKIDLLVDGGPTTLKRESTVLDLTKIPPVILREGVLPAAEINLFLEEEGYEFQVQKLGTRNSKLGTRTTKVLFICTGNTCRSPMAAALFKKYLKEKLGEKAARVQVSSAGIAAVPGAKVPPFTFQVMKERGIDLESHRAQIISKSLLHEADFIITLGREHPHRLIELNPAPVGLNRKLKKKIFPLEILDPIGQDYQFYEKCARQLEKALPKILDKLFS